ncbi:FAD-dependent oxidoreductase [Pyrolobus fumarii]|uniref:FAD-dependent oxidoreductase n=1 Tax=Pyrolobus fumarii TaxID=54252 RepID=UPI00064E6C2F
MEKLGVYDVVVVGAGLAGLMAAIHAAQRGVSVLVVSKSHPVRSHTAAAEGGIAAWIPGASDPRDSWLQHAYDTVKGGDFLVDQHAAEILAREAYPTIMLLERWGVLFTRDEEGRIARRPFGGHRYPRTRFVEDKTGMAIMHVVYEQALRLGIDMLDEVFALDVVVWQGRVYGVVAVDLREARPLYIQAKAVVLAAGGAGMIYKHTTNNYFNTGDGYAMALRAGAALKDMEFIQFHPTALYPTDILITEAARGEGGHLINAKGERFMARYAPQWMELAPRDVVARAIATEILEGRGFEGGYVLLDLTHLGEERIRERLPTVREAARRYAGVDPAKEPIPVRPAQHYMMGGVDVDIDGHSPDVTGLFAAGETACISVHGANRLGSNSLLEAAVFGKRAGLAAASYALGRGSGEPPAEAVREPVERLYSLLRRERSGVELGEARRELREVMWVKVGLFREEKGLAEAVSRLTDLYKRVLDGIVVPSRGRGWYDLALAYETLNMVTVGLVVARAALERRESRGAHYRLDYPKRDDENYLKHSLVRLRGDSLEVGWRKVEVRRWEPGERAY